MQTATLRHETTEQAGNRYAIGNKSNLPNYSKHSSAFVDKHPEITAESEKRPLENGSWRAEADRTYKSQANKRK